MENEKKSEKRKAIDPPEISKLEKIGVEENYIQVQDFYKTSTQATTVTELGSFAVFPREVLSFKEAMDYFCINGYLDMLCIILQDSRVDPSAKDNWAIRFASESGHLAVVERLLQDKRMDPSAINNYAVGLASVNGHLAVVERLLQDSRVEWRGKM